MGTSEKCSGKHTWDRNGNKTVIDYVFTDESLYDRVKSKRVDGDGEIDIKSGHKFIQACLRRKKRYERRKNTEDKKIEYYSKTETDLEGLVKNIMSRLKSSKL